jgi:vacuolar-type H+-ATPase subunit H
MSPSSAPLIIAFGAAGLLLLLIGIIPAIRRSIERFRLTRRTPKSEDAITSAWVYQPPVLGEEPVAPSNPIAEAHPSDGVLNRDKPSPAAAIEEAEPDAAELPVAAEQQPDVARRANEAGAERTTGEALVRTPELLEEAELEARRVPLTAGKELARTNNELEEERAAFARRSRLDSLSAIQQAELKAEELLADAELQRANLVGKAEAEAQRKATEITQDAERRARERLEEAELEAKEIVVATSTERAHLLRDLEDERSHMAATRAKLDSLTAMEEAAQQAEELLVAAEQRREHLVREAEAAAERNTAEITERARREARELLQRAEHDAARIIAVAGQERARLLDELAKERADFEESRTKLAGFLAGALEEVEAAPTADERPANVRDLDEARTVRTSAGADR